MAYACSAMDRCDICHIVFLVKGSQALDVEEKQGNGVCPSTRTIEVQKLSDVTNCLSPGPGASLAPGVSADYSGQVGFVKFLGY